MISVSFNATKIIFGEENPEIPLWHTNVCRLETTLNNKLMMSSPVSDSILSKLVLDYSLKSVVWSKFWKESINYIKEEFDHARFKLPMKFSDG